MRRLFYFFFGIMFSTSWLSAQSADDLFHQSASVYISGDTPGAKKIIEYALKQFPNDLKLQSLKKKMKDEEQKQQNQQNQNQQKQDQQKQDQQQQAQQKKQQLSKQDAERILEALKNEEKDVQKKLKKKVPARVNVEKDW